MIKSVSGTQIRKKIGVHSRKRVLGNIGSFRSGKEANRAGPWRMIERVEASLEQHIAPKLTAETAHMYYLTALWVRNSGAA